MIDENGRFLGFLAPQYTQVPDEVFDELLSDLSGAELKVLLYVIRRTFGFKRDRDTISLNQMMRGIKTRQGLQLDRGVGLAKPTIIRAVQSLVRKNVLITQKSRGEDRAWLPTAYSLNVIGGSQSTLLPRSRDVTTHGHAPLPPLVAKRDTQETVLQEPDSQEQTPTSALRRPHTQQDVAAISLRPTKAALRAGLTELGVAAAVARKIVYAHDASHVARMIEYTCYKLSLGWRPKESVAAWLVSAVREGFETPEHFRTRAEMLAAAREAKGRQAREQKRNREAREREEAQTRREREELVLRLGGSEEAEKIWTAAQERLRARGDWTVSMLSALLVVPAAGPWRIVVEEEFARARIAERLQVVRQALREVVGRDIEVQLERAKA